MSTYMQDLRKTNPTLAKAYAVCGNQSRHCLKNMVHALGMLPALNSAEDERRLAAAVYILKHTKG